MENNTAIQNNTADIIAENKRESQEENENIMRNAAEKIKEQAETASGQNVPAVAIYHYLVDKCENSEDFAKAVLNESKTVSKCFTYITDKAYEAAAAANITADTNNNAPLGIGMSSDEIFALAEEYFTLSDDEIKKRREDARAELEKRRKELRAARQETEKKKAESKKDTEKKSVKPEKAPDAQMSFFD